MKDDTISRAAAIDAMMKLQAEDIEAYGASIPEGFDGDRAVTAIKALPSAQPSVSKTETVEDCISRQAAIKTAHLPVIDDASYEVVRVDDILALPSAQPNLDEWCDDCKEYDKERHCCPRWNRVIRQTVEDMKAAQPGWIPCDRELPKPNEEDGNGFYKAYLVQDGRWMDVARWDGKYWVAWGYSTVLLNVVAWMPLPAPYIPEGDDKHEG